MMPPDEDLFPNARSLSPLAEWKRRNLLITVQEDPNIVGEESPETGDVCAAFYCMKDDGIYQTQDLAKIGRGDTEESAAMDYAQRNALKPWQVEGGI